MDTKDLRKDGRVNGRPASMLEPGDRAYLKGKNVLVTGGTGSFGQRCVKALLATDAAKVIVLSRDELKQSEMQAHVPDGKGNLRFFIGDIRDRERLRRAFHGVHYVVHAAALKQVPALEYNPYEAVLTNVVGSQNVLEAAIDAGVGRVMALSTDKAVNPINLYGATKLCAEKLLVAGNSYAGKTGTRFSVARYGNVVGSRGSVIPLFAARRKTGVLPITDERMTRFWMTLDQGVNFVLNCLGQMHGGEVFVPKIPSMKLVDLARTIGPECKLQPVGIRPGEKLHEVLLTEDESAHALDMGSFFILEPLFGWWNNGHWSGGTKTPAGFRYTSNDNDSWLSSAQLREMVDGPKE